MDLSSLPRLALPCLGGGDGLGLGGGGEACTGDGPGCRTEIDLSGLPRLALPCLGGGDGLGGVAGGGGEACPGVGGPSCRREVHGLAEKYEDPSSSSSSESPGTLGSAHTGN